MEKTETEIRMEELLKEGETIVDDSYLKTQDARRILDAGYSLLQHHCRVKKSRDSWRKKYETVINNANLGVKQ